jgi:cytochrome c556
MKRIILISAAILSTIISFNTFAQRMSPEEQAEAAIGSRQAVFKLLAFSMVPLQGMARGGDFDQAVAVQALERIQTLAPMIPELFANDTTDYDFETRALNSIWGDMGGFANAANDLSMGAAAAMDIITSQGADGVRAAIQQVGPTCGACHDAFRAE